MKAYVAIQGHGVIEARGRSKGTTHGELVFTTAYTGYEESLTDPSYCKQVLTFSYPLIGNYGVRQERFESNKIQAEACIARELTDEIESWFVEENIPALDHIDTRNLVTLIRENGAMNCGIAVGNDVTPSDATDQLSQCKGMNSYTDIGSEVSVSRPHVYNKTGNTRIALVDCGAKRGIIKSLVERNATVFRLPYDVQPEVIETISPDVLFISNGPGNPAAYTNTIDLVKEYAGKIPIAGICLGQQIVALALGGDTEKMEFGHRGVNQPVRDLKDDRVVMTTQNHGYTVIDSGEHLTPAQVNVNDGTVEAFENHEMQIYTRQYHPEANPGPHDSLSFFDTVITSATTDLVSNFEKQTRQQTANYP